VNTDPLLCPYGDAPPADLLAWEEAWEGRPALEYSQSWLPSPMPEFLPGRVQTGWSDQGWHVLAILQDKDIFNTARSPSEASWESGDVFEIFLRPGGQDSYFEIHLTPENSGVRFRFPSTEFYWKMNGIHRPKTSWAFEHSYTPAHLSTSTLVQADRGRWLAGATLPFSDFLENGETVPEQPWRVSFCRYDYTRGRQKPVCSSTSKQAKAAFHRQTHWSPLTFARP